MLVFVDGSGRPVPTDPNSHSAFAAVLLREEDSRTLTRNLYQLKYSRFRSDQVEMKASALITRGTFFGRSVHWQIPEAFFELIRHVPMTVFGVIVERPTDESAESRGPAGGDGVDTLAPVPPRLPDHYRFLLQRVQLYMQETYPSTTEMATIVFDEDDRRSDQRLARAFAAFMYRSPEGHRSQRIVETCLFGNSRIIPGLQVADFCASVLRQAEQLGVRTVSQWTVDKPYPAAIRRLYQIVEDKSRDYPNAMPGGQTLYGISIRRAVRRARGLAVVAAGDSIGEDAGELTIVRPENERKAEE
jgi:hypothetical protein